MSRANRTYGERKPWVAPAGYGVDVTRPAEGFYRCKLRGGSVYVGIRIWYGPPLDPVTGEELDRGWRWQAQANGELIDLDDCWPVCADEPITAEECRTYCKRQEWARQHAPDSAFADPRKRYDPLDRNEVLPF